MDFNTTIDLIIKDLKEAAEIIDDLKKYPGVPALQVELAKAKCRSAADVIALLKSLGNTFSSEKVPEKDKPEMNASKGSQKNTAETPILADKFTPPTGLYDEQSARIKSEKDLSDHLKAKQITSLSEAIGISDKFLFMGEIFNSNKDAYNQAISRLDKVESLDDARAIIMSYLGDNSENDAVAQLLELVKLKLPPNE
jgi:hypothetical protein